MAIFQGADNYFWFWIVMILTILTALAVWYWTIVGRDVSPTRQRRGENTIERYGTIEEDRAPTPKFLYYMYWGIAVWAIGYALWTGIEGIGM